MWSVVWSVSLAGCLAVAAAQQSCCRPDLRPSTGHVCWVGTGWPCENMSQRRGRIMRKLIKPVSAGRALGDKSMRSVWQCWC
jgi:hypothetical protein